MLESWGCNLYTSAAYTRVFTVYIDCGSFVLTKTCIKTGAKGLFAIGSLLYISYSKNKTTILWLVDGSKSGCCRSISCNQQQQQQNDTEIVA